MKLLALLFLASALWGQTTITGTFAYPDGSSVSGRVIVSLTRSTVANTCGSNQVVTFSPVTVQITGGVLGSLSLLPTPCLCLKLSGVTCTQQSGPYLVKVYSSANVMLYSGNWTVPNTGSADVTELDSK